MKLYACTTVGGTRYLKVWLGKILKLNPVKIAIARDLSRSEPLQESPEYVVIDYDTKTPWKSYETRHERWESDKSILIGIITLMEDFLKTEATHFLHIDSDVIISDSAIKMILKSVWDYLKFGIPVIPRELPPQEIRHWRRHIGMFWDSTCFGISKRLVERVVDPARVIANDPYPIDIKLHSIIAEEFKKINNGAFKCIDKIGITHYIKGESVTL